MADQLTEEQILEFQEAFSLFESHVSTPPNHESSETFVTLENSTVFVNIEEHYARVDVVECFCNHDDRSVEFIYSVPMLPGSSLVAFSAVLNNQVIHATVKEKLAARAQYQYHLDDNITSFLAEDTSGSFTFNLGGINGREKVIVKFSYFMELHNEDRFVFPVHLLSPSNGYTASVISNSNIIVCVQQSRQCRITSPSHHIVPVTGAQVPQSARSNAFQWAGWAPLSSKTDADFVLQLEFASSPEHGIDRAWVSVCHTHVAAHIITVPTIPQSQSNTDSAREYLKRFVFVIDCSGSMGGAPIKAAKEALQLFVRSLQLGSHFNIIAFGSSYKTLFRDRCAEYSDTSLLQATQWISSLDANLGGTDLMEPLEEALAAPFTCCFLLTDGQVVDRASIESLAARRKAEGVCRVFTVGVGNGVDRQLVEGLASKTGASQLSFTYYTLTLCTDMSVSSGIRRRHM
jgi:von Willebrand factor A domain-containing protein 5